MTTEDDASGSDDPDADATARAKDFLDRLEANGRIADEVRRLLVQSARLVVHEFNILAGEDHWPHLPTTPHYDDRETPVDERYGTVADLVRDEARLDLHTVADTLRGYAALVETQSSFVGAVACGRAVYESSIWAASVLDPALAPEQRAWRALTRRLARLHATQRHITLLEADADPDPAAAEEIEHILDLAKSRDWTILKNKYAPSIGTRLSVDQLAPTLPGALGVEGYAWSSASALIHGEQPTLAQSWISFSFDRIPAWLTGMWTPSVPLGTRIALMTASEYLGEVAGDEAWNLLHRTWDTACSQMSGWRV